MGEQPTCQRYDFFATCPRNTEGLLLAELKALGVTEARETRAGVAFTGPLELGYRSCLWSRVASRVLLRLKSHPVDSIDDLYEVAKTIEWDEHLSPSGTLAVEVTSAVRRGPLARANTHFLEQRVKDAVVDFFRSRTGSRPSVNLGRPNVRINVHLAVGEAPVRAAAREGAAREEAAREGAARRAAAAAPAAAAPTEVVFSLDLSGSSLHQRGYRTEAGEAPLKENLAAAILLRAGWPQIAAAGGSLVDPLCGSGTLVIEAALVAADIAPGLLRDYFGFLGWKGHDSSLWQSLLAEALERRQEGLRRLPPLYGYDADPRAIAVAQANAHRAGLGQQAEGKVVFAVRDVASLERDVVRPLRPRGLVATNPPYGHRLGKTSQLATLYQILGEKLKAVFAGWEAAILAADLTLTDHLGLRAHRVNMFYNGSLPCRLLLFHLNQSSALPDSHITRPAITAGAQMFANRLRKNLKRLRSWAAREEVHCFRVYDADLPEYNVAIDLYEDWAHVQEYAPPATVDPVKARRRLKEVLSVIPEVLSVPPEHVVLKIRQRQRGSAQYQKLGEKRKFVEVREGDLRFLVNLTDYLDTGLFLDHRLTRRLIRQLAQGRRFLNLFGYTGSATVYAAAGGASATTTVDLSATYLEWAQRNLELNGLSGPQHSFIRADCREWLVRAAEAASAAEEAAQPRQHRVANHGGAQVHGELYDLIFLDAPTFSNSKKTTSDLDIQRDHAELIRVAARLLSPDGVLIFSTNFRRFKLDPKLAQEFAVTDITKQTIPPDFARNPRIHRCFVITLGNASVPESAPGQEATSARRHPSTVAFPRPSTR